MQRTLFKESWKELYIINLAHWTITMSTVASGDYFEQSVQTYLNSLINEINICNDKSSSTSSSSSFFIGLSETINNINGQGSIKNATEPIFQVENSINNEQRLEIIKRHFNEKQHIRLDIQNIKIIIDQFKNLNLDGTECGCLKAIALFNPGK